MLSIGDSELKKTVPVLEDSDLWRKQGQEQLQEGLMRMTEPAPRIHTYGLGGIRWWGGRGSGQDRLQKSQTLDLSKATGISKGKSTEGGNRMHKIWKL